MTCSAAGAKPFAPADAVPYAGLDYEVVRGRCAENVVGHVLPLGVNRGCKAIAAAVSVGAHVLRSAHDARAVFDASFARPWRCVRG